jgi:hypothetical protein
MSNEDKTDGLFSADKDILNENDVSLLRLAEEQSQSEGCPKYIGVISFDNSFLKENGWIVGDKIDIDKIKSVTRKAVANMVDESKKLNKDNVYWTAAIHLNTDNVHVHFQLLENHRLEDRRVTYAAKGKDKIEQEAFERLKSTVVSEMLTQKRTPMLTKIKREILIPNIRENITAADSLGELLNELPPTKKAWQYNRRAMRPFHERINRCVDEIIESDDEIGKEFARFKSELESMSRQYRELYGERKNTEIAEYAQNQLDDFYQRAGNALLKELFEIKNTEQFETIAAVMPDNSSSPQDGANDETEQAATPYLLKKKFFELRQDIEEEKDPIVREEKISHAEEIAKSDEADFAKKYLAFLFYKERDEKRENREKAEKYLHSCVELGTDTAAYLLGRLYLEDGRKKEGVEMIKLAADRGIAAAQFTYGKIAKDCGNRECSQRYISAAAQSGYVPAVKELEKTPPKVRLKGAFSSRVRQSAVQSRIMSNRCANAVRKLLKESDAHLKRLQSEYEYEQLHSQNAYGGYADFEREY